MRVDRAELPPGGNSALKLTERGKAPMVSPHLAPNTQSPGLSRQSLPLGTTPLSNHPSIHPFIYSAKLPESLLCSKHSTNNIAVNKMCIISAFKS